MPREGWLAAGGLMLDEIAWRELDGEGCRVGYYPGLIPTKRASEVFAQLMQVRCDANSARALKVYTDFTRAQARTYKHTGTRTAHRHTHVHTQQDTTRVCAHARVRVWTQVVHANTRTCTRAHANATHAGD